jgi:hypothetical protein
MLEDLCTGKRTHCTHCISPPPLASLRVNSRGSDRKKGHTLGVFHFYAVGTLGNGLA